MVACYVVNKCNCSCSCANSTIKIKTEHEQHSLCLTALISSPVRIPS